MGDTYPGSDGATDMVAWIDTLLVAVREGRRAEAGERIDAGHWRASLDLGGIPGPMIDAAADALSVAAERLRDPDVPVDEAVDALLVARARFLPGA